VKFLIRRLRMSDAQELAKFGLSCDSGAEILEHCRALAQRVAPGLFQDDEKKSQN
jgi:hypothetical protein